MDEWCKLYGCRHKLISIGEKELNGKVENTHKYDDEEFFSQIQARTYAELKFETIKHNWEWNENRKTKTLGWRTPSEVIDEVKVSILLILLFCRNQEAEQEVINPVMIKKTQLPPKLKSIEARYFAWMAWEASQYPKVALVSGMSLIYSCLFLLFVGD